MKIEQKKLFTLIVPKNGYKLSNKDKTEMYDNFVYLGKYDSPDNYIEVTINEYEEWLQNKTQEVENAK